MREPQYLDRENGCADCGRLRTGVLFWFARWAGLRSCTIRNSEGVTRKSVEPFFKGGRRLCLACFKVAAEEEQRATPRFH